MVAVYAFTSTGSSTVARPAKSRGYLGIYNQSGTATIYLAFDTAAVGSATAGQITLLPATGSNVSAYTWGPGDPQNIPSGSLNFNGAGPVTIIEG